MVNWTEGGLGNGLALANDGVPQRGHGRRNMPRRKVLTLAETLAVYFQDCRVQGYKDSTIQGYQRTFRCFLRWADTVGITTLPQLSAEAVKRYIAFVQQKPKWADKAQAPTRKQTVSATTVRNYVRDLKAFASWLECEGYTVENVLGRVRKPKADEIPPGPLTQGALAGIFRALH